MQPASTARHAAVGWAAFLWGLFVFFSISLNYVGLLGLLLTLALDSNTWRARQKRLRTSPHWWPALLFMGWFTVILVTGAHYPETASNAGHTFRIVLTLAAVVMLDRKEVLMAVRGFTASLILVLILIIMNHVVGLPDLALWHGALQYTNNKSIATAILLAVTATSILILLPRMSAATTIISLIMLAVILFVLAVILHSRTAWMILMAGILVGVVCSIRTKPKWTSLLAAVALALIAAGVLTPSVRDHVTIGISQVMKARQDPVHVSETSWGLRYIMYVETSRMIRRHPVTGNGIGSWNTIWRERAPKNIRYLNMPHNDFLWMGMQAGIPGVFLFLAMIAASLPARWRQRHADGGLGVMAMVGLLIAISLNSALRDAAIGLPLWFVVLLWQRVSEQLEPQRPMR
ncbi:MAG: O-antigen ligase family protein [Ottowia sp.]|nr:O-antigen ligase family protein [Ottowia sp.]